MSLLSLLVATLFLPASTQAVDVDVAPPPKVCVESNKDCYYVYAYLYDSCLAGYDSDDNGSGVGYVCTRPLGVCAINQGSGYGSTCVRLLMYNGGGETCVVNYSGWEYNGYDSYVCYSTE